MDARMWQAAENAMLGQADSPQDIAAVKSGIQAKLNELEALYKRLQDISLGTGRRRLSQEVALDLRTQCPFLEIENVRTDGMPGSSEGFTITVVDSPFFIFDGSGTALGSTLPVNRMSLSVTHSGITGFRLNGQPWARLASEVRRGDQRGERFATGREYGHPHCSERASGSYGSSSGPGSMCMGHGDRANLARNIDSQARMILCVKALYAWLTELNVDSMFNTSMSPIKTKDAYLHEAIIPACVHERRNLLRAVSTDQYAAFVRELRDGVFTAELADGMIAAATSALLAGSLSGTMIAGHVNGVLDSLERTGTRHDTLGLMRVAIALHQLMGAALTLSGDATIGYSVLRDAASTIVAVHSNVWKDAALGTRLMGESSTSLNFGVANRFFADWWTVMGGMADGR